MQLRIKSLVAFYFTTYLFYYIQKVPQADSERLPKGTKIITIIQITEEVKEHPDSAD